MQHVINHCGNCFIIAVGAHPVRQVLTQCGGLLHNAAVAYSVR